MLIGVTGCSGSGKSTFVKHLQSFIGEECTIFTQDNYYIPRENQPKDENGIQNFDLPQSLDLTQYYKDLIALSQGASIFQNKYNYNNPLLPKEQILVTPSKYIIAEGLFVFYDEEKLGLFDHKVFIEGADNISFERRLYRDKVERGYDFDDVNYRFYNHVLPSYQSYILPRKNQCGIVIDNTDNDLELLKSKALDISKRVF
jgi:uridine kinase